MEPLRFPFLLGRAFIEAKAGGWGAIGSVLFPFLLGRAFIEASNPRNGERFDSNFPSFWEGLSLRRD